MSDVRVLKDSVASQEHSHVKTDVYMEMRLQAQGNSLDQAKSRIEAGKQHLRLSQQQRGLLVPPAPPTTPERPRKGTGLAVLSPQAHAEESAESTTEHSGAHTAISVDDLSQSDSSQRAWKREIMEGDAQPSLAIAPTTIPRDAKPFHEWEEAAIMGALVQCGGERALQNLKYNTKSDLVAALIHAAEDGLPFITRILEGGTYTQWWTTRWGVSVPSRPRERSVAPKV